MDNLQLKETWKEIDEIQRKHGHPDYTALYGTGCIKKPKIMFLFMNPTAKNLSTKKEWVGIRAPWIGLKNTWKLMTKLGFLSEELNTRIQTKKAIEWDNAFALEIYNHVANKKAYLTNLARCTQPDARHVPDIVFRESRDITLKEISLINPEVIISFGNQVSSNLLKQPVKVSEWRCKKFDLIIGKKKYAVYPTYYPVGMGFRNIGKAIEDIKKILKQHS